MPEVFNDLFITYIIVALTALAGCYINLGSYGKFSRKLLQACFITIILSGIAAVITILVAVWTF